MVEKDLVKFFRKHLNLEDLPLKGVSKQRGKNFAFLKFLDVEEMKHFKELYCTEIGPKFPKQKLKEVNKKPNEKDFKPVKDREEMKEDAEKKKEKQLKSLT